MGDMEQYERDCLRKEAAMDQMVDPTMEECQKYWDLHHTNQWYIDVLWAQPIIYHLPDL